MSEQMLLIPHIQVLNANAHSSPFTIGFPALTAWLGGVHAVERKLNAAGCQVTFTGVGVVSHEFDLQVHKGVDDFVNSVVGTSNPLVPKTEKSKPKGNAVRPSFVEEPRCHLEVSLVVGFEGLEAHEQANLISEITRILSAGMRFAGGDVIDFNEPQIVHDFLKLKRALMPGYAIIDRRDLMIEAMESGQDAFDALLDYLVVHNECVLNEETKEVSWTRARKSTSTLGESGWIVPIAVGFQGIGEIGQALNQRDSDTQHRFAECVVTLGEFRMPFRLEGLQDLLWRYDFDEENSLYLCKQENKSNLSVEAEY